MSRNKEREKKIEEIDAQIEQLTKEKTSYILEEHNEERKKMNALTFNVTKDHIKLLKNMNVDWWDCEFGAPCIDPKRPYGNSDVIEDMAIILGLTTQKEIENADDGIGDIISEAQENKLADIHKEMQIVLQICVVNNGVKVGKYKRSDEYECDWRLVK